MSEPLGEPSLITTDRPDASRRMMIVAALVVTAGLVLGGAFWLGSSTGEDLEPLSVAVETDEDEDAPPVTEDDPEGAVEAPPVVTYEVYLARDPFEPVREPEPEPAPDLDPADPTDPSDPADPTDPTDPSHPTDPSDPTTDPSGPRDPSDPAPRDDACAGGGEEAVCDGHVVSLLDIVSSNGQPTAVVQVDTTVYEVREGENFAERFRLLDIDREAGSVTGVFGDSRFTLQVGDSTMK